MSQKIDGEENVHSRPKGYIAFDQVDYRNKWVYFIVSLVIVIYLCQIKNYFIDINLRDFESSEFLINYEGGFVRRGLLGQLLYWIYSTTGFSVVTMIQIISACAYLVVVCFFLRRFSREGYSWWFLFSPVVFGFYVSIIRKDFLEMVLLIGMIALIKEQSPSIFNRILATMIAIVGLLMHEAFFFWGIPCYALLLLGNYGSRKEKFENLLLMLAIFATFGLMVVFKGNTETAQAIRDSWNAPFGRTLLEDNAGNSINALGWSIDYAVQHHKIYNLYGSGGVPLGIFWQPVWAIAIYYFCTNFIFVFHKPGMHHVKERKLAFSALYSFTFICMLPMFILLSCDYARLYYYISAAALTVFVLIPTNRILKIFPGFYLKTVNKINDAFVRYFPPRRPILLVMLLCLAIAYAGFNFEENFHNSIIYKSVCCLLAHIVTAI